MPIGLKDMQLKFQERRDRHRKIFKGMMAKHFTVINLNFQI